ncbi:MAG TPA: tetratricopeptide repeat protein [Acidimicrobiales bacterium]
MTTAPTHDERSLEEEREFLLRSIADLDAEHAAGDLDDADYRALRDGYTARAAEVIRLLGAEKPVFRPERAQKREAGSPSGRRFVAIAVGVGVIAVALAAGWLVAQASGERVSGSAATGSVPESSTDRIARAQQLVAEGKALEAIKTYDALLDDDPENPIALAERGWLLSRVDPSLAEQGLKSIDKAIAVDPGYPEAHFFRGMILLQARDDPVGAVASFEAAIAAGPPPDLVELFEQARDRAREAANARA